MERVGIGKIFSSMSTLFMCTYCWTRGKAFWWFAKVSMALLEALFADGLPCSIGPPCPCLGMVFDALYIRAPWAM
ncbi:MAG: hypothetical protein CFE39_08045 [Comamonadaceae bacterium PBBC2]|nr:MAG: hypothetical protein CFE39_08045 [Comamonadaceae bacterium PBBC2]